MTASTTQSAKDGATAPEATIQAIYVSRRSAAPMESRRSTRLIPGKGIDGDRYALGTGTYSARFMSEPGKQLTMVSLEGIVEHTDRTGMKPFHKDNMGELRRNIVLSGISVEKLNDMVGHEVRIGKRGRVFVHRRTVPCKYREAACRRPGLMNNLWNVCGVNCEVLEPLDDETRVAEISLGDTVAVLPNTHQPERIDVGRKPPGWFIRPADRTLEDVKQMIKPTYIAAIACLIDPEGFQRVEDAYMSVGQCFWSPDAYAIGLLFKAIRIPFVVVIFAIVVAIGLHFAGIEIK